MVADAFGSPVAVGLGGGVGGAAGDELVPPPKCNDWITALTLF